MIIFITLSFAGAESGPFDLYSDVDGFTTPFAQNVSKADLLLGYEVVAPDGTTTVRLLDLGADCAPFTTDIYNCATPNCDFSGEINCIIPDCNFSGTIDCPAPETTTTTTTGYPGFSPCTWSTYGGNPGEIAVYDFNTNSSTVVLVPNDFTTTSGINRPICSTSSKLWLASYPTSSTACEIIKDQPEGFPSSTVNGTKTLSNGVVMTASYEGPNNSPIISQPSVYDACDGFYSNSVNGTSNSAIRLKVGGSITLTFDPPISEIAFIGGAWGYNRSELGNYETVSVTSPVKIEGETLAACTTQETPTTYETLQINDYQVDMRGRQVVPSFNTGVTSIKAVGENISELKLENISPTQVAGVIFDFFVCASSDSSTSSVEYIREWDIDTSGPTPTLSFVREISIDVDNLSSSGIWGSEITAIATTADNNTLLAGFGARDDGETSMGVYSWDISTSGNILLNENNKIDKATVSFGNTYGITTELTGMFITNDDNVILSARYYENESPNNAANRVRQYEGLDLSSWTSSSPVINLQQRGVPEFTNAWTSTSKAMPVWGVNGLLQVIQPETLKVYNIDQVGPYNATLSGTVADDTVWIHTSTGCANVNIQYDDCEEATWIPALTEQVDGEWVYTGPATFTYAGVEVTASASQDNMQLRSGDTVGGIPQEGCSGISNPAANGVLRSVRGFDFTITLSFSEPVNNIPIRAAVLNSQPDLSGGDVYTFDTNTGTPNVSISVGCNVQVQGNIIGGGVPDYDTEGDGEFIITSDTPFTILTISGDAPTGGPILLGCSVPPLNCRLVYSTDSAGNSCSSPSNEGRCLPGQIIFKKYFAWDVNTNTQQEVLLPPSTATSSPNFALSENYIIVDVSSLVTGVKSLARYGYTDINGIPSDTTFDGQFIDYPAGNVRNHGSIMEAVTDTKFLGTWQQGSNQSFPTSVSQILEWELSGTTLSYSVKIDVGVNHGYYVAGDLLLTFKTDGTPNKIIVGGYVPPLQPDNSNPGYLLQFDYTTNALDGVVNLPAGVRGTAALSIYDGGIYIGPPDWSTVAPEFAGVWRFDLETLQWTQLDPADVPTEMGLPSSGPGDFASTPICRVSDGITSFDPPPTTTTTTTVIPEGINTIWIKFDPITPA